MKTSVIMKRVLGNHEVRQDSKDGTFNATDLLSVWNAQGHPGRKRRMESYFRRKETKDMQEAILKRLNQDSTNSCYLPENIVRTSKGMKTERGGTWMHPYLFIDFAMWLSPDFKVLCIEWIYDNLIKLRNDVGDDYKELMTAIKLHLKPVSDQPYRDEIKMINKLVFGSEQSGQRQIANQEQLALLKTLQKADIKLMAEGKDYSQRITSLHRLKQLL